MTTTPMIPNETPIDLSHLPGEVIDMLTGEAHPVTEDLRQTVRNLTLGMYRSEAKLKAAQVALEEKAAAELKALQEATTLSETAREDLARVLKLTWPGGGFAIPVGDLQVSLSKSTPQLAYGNQRMTQDDVDAVAGHVHEVNGEPLFLVQMDLSVYAAALDAGLVPPEIHEDMLAKGLLTMKYRSPSFSVKPAPRKDAMKTAVARGGKG